MSSFFDNNITDAGKQLIAEMQAGGKFAPTRIVIGSGYLPTGKTTRTMTAVAEPVQSITITKSEKLENGDFIFGGDFTNKDVTSAFYYRELALYAKVTRADGTETAETLYSYGNAGVNAELIPAYSTGTALERKLDIITYIGNDANVNLEIASGIYIDYATFNSAIAAILARNIDCGFFTDELDVAMHDATGTAHSNMVLDANVTGITPESQSETLEEHMANQNAHSNLIVDGNGY